MTRTRNNKAPTRIIALGGGKGGAGRSTLTAELGRALARADQKVLLVDFEGHHRALSTLLELEMDTVKSRRMGRGMLTSSRPSLLADVISNNGRLSLLALHGGEAAQDVSGKEIARWLRQAEADWVLVDLPAHHHDLWNQLFLSADVPMLVVLPEPVGVRAATRFLQGCLRIAVKMHPEAHPEREGLLARMDQEGPSGYWDNLAVDPHSQELLEEVTSRMSVALVLNQVREPNEAEQAYALAHAWGIALGLWPRVQPSIPYEDRKWFYARRLAQQASHPRDESMAGASGVLARAFLGMDWMAWSEPRPCLACLDALAEPRVFLDLPDHGQSPAEIRQGYRRLWEGYRREHGLASQVFQPQKRQEALALLDGSFKALTVDHASAGPAAVAATASGTASSPQHRIHPGQIVRTARLKAGLGLRELSLHTRVGVRHLEAIEAMSLEALPDPLYLEAYLSEIARPLGLEPGTLVNEYMEAITELKGKGA